MKESSETGIDVNRFKILLAIGTAMSLSPYIPLEEAKVELYMSDKVWLQSKYQVAWGINLEELDS